MLADAFAELIERKRNVGADAGFEPTFMPEILFDFQQYLAAWNIRKGRSGCFADCGMGKSGIEATWAENVARHTDRPVLVLTPNAVVDQAIEEAAKFGVEMARGDGGKVHRITATNYEKLHLFNPLDFAGVVCDESSILKSFDGVRQEAITQFLSRTEYRLLGSATAAPNDYTELGTSSEALGYIGATDILQRFFKNDLGNSAKNRSHGKTREWRFKGHAETPFWRYVASWARACRRPSDLGFDDGPFVLPPLREEIRDVFSDSAPADALFAMPASTMDEQREEAKRTLGERCEIAASLVADTGRPAALWCHTNAEAALLRQLLPNAVEVSGDDGDEAKEEKFKAFSSGQALQIITKPKIGAWGLNWQHCAHVVYFPTYSFEQYYQAVRRCWRFGQKSAVTVDLPCTAGQRAVFDALMRKAEQADRMFAELVRHMNEERHVAPLIQPAEIEAPAWL